MQKIEENNRIGKTRDLFKKIRDTKGPFHAKMGSIMDRNGRDLTEAADIKKRWQGYTEELYKRELHDPDNHDGVITHLQPDILECEVKCALKRISMDKVSGDDGMKTDFSSPVATAEFSKFAGILSAALSQHHLSRLETVQLEFHHLH